MLMYMRLVVSWLGLKSACYRQSGMVWRIMVGALNIVMVYDLQVGVIQSTFLRFFCTKRYCYAYRLSAIGPS